MNKIFNAFCCCLSAVFVFIGCNSVPQRFSTSDDDSHFLAIDSLISGWIDNGIVPNYEVLVVKDGRKIYHKAFGFRDIENGEKAQTGDLYRLASNTKAVTVAGLMQLWEKRLFQIDDSISTYIPEFCGSGITIRHLLGHTSGICYDGRFADSCRVRGVVLHNTLTDITLEENVRRIATLPLAHRPGEKYTYSFNTEVLGRLIEVLSGEGYEQYIKNHILAPLAMNHTGFHFSQSEIVQSDLKIVKLYSRTDSLILSKDTYLQRFPTDGIYCSPSAGLVGSAEDYARFCQMILNGGCFNGHRILKPQTVSMMQQNLVGDLRGEIGMSFAWDYFTDEALSHLPYGKGSMRWGGMFGTDYLIDPVSNLIVISKTNCYPNNSGVRTKQLILNTVYRCLSQQ